MVVGSLRHLAQDQVLSEDQERKALILGWCIEWVRVCCIIGYIYTQYFFCCGVVHCSAFSCLCSFLLSCKRSSWSQTTSWIAPSPDEANPAGINRSTESFNHVEYYYYYYYNRYYNYNYNSYSWVLLFHQETFHAMRSCSFCFYSSSHVLWNISGGCGAGCSERCSVDRGHHLQDTAQTLQERALLSQRCGTLSRGIQAIELYTSY